MDSKSIFSALSFVAVACYLYVGLYTYNHNRKSIINRTFLLLCISYAVWSFAYAFAYSAYNKFVFEIWNKISALGWCSFSAISLYLVLLITDNRFAKYRITKILIFSPAIIFFYMAVFLFGEKIKTPLIISNIFYVGNFLYNFIFLLLSIILIFVWGIKTDSKRIKVQSQILVVTSIVPFCIDLFIQTILPMMGFKNYPLMGQLYALIMIIGTYIVIEKYKFLRIPEKVVLEEIENKIIDMILVTNEKGELIKISNHTLNLLGFDERELIKKGVNIIFDNDNKEKFILSNLMKEEVRYNDIGIVKKTGERISVNVHCMPIWDKKIHDFLGTAIVMQDISIEHELRRKNEELHEKAIRDGLTKLYNHQHSVELIKREINDLDEDGDKKELSLMMIDIDFFKTVNDNYGHIFGDKVLKTVADIIVGVINSDGHVGRFGGEEFIIILPKTGLKKAYEIGEKIRYEIENFNFGDDLRLTVSIGVKQFENQFSIDFIKKTDDLLYKAKQNGRNRVEL